MLDSQTEAARPQEAQPQYLRNAWYPALWACDLGDKAVERTLLEEEIVIYRDANGAPIALANRCPHRFVQFVGPKLTGKVIGNNIQCPYHGLQFNASGACAHNPHGGRLATARVKSYPVIERHKAVWLWMGEPNLADPALIPDYSFMDRDDEFIMTTGVIPLEADYMLYCDNLLDLTHTEYLHSFFEAESLDRISTVKVTQEGNLVRVRRDFPAENITKSEGFLATIASGVGKRVGDTVHVRDEVTWRAPGNLTLKTIHDPEGERSSMFLNAHIAVPTQRGRSQLLWSTMINFAHDRPELVQTLGGLVAAAVKNEDMAAMESQQTYILNRDLMSLSPVVLKTDEPTVRARRILDRMIKNEQSGRADR